MGRMAGHLKARVGIVAQVTLDQGVQKVKASQEICCSVWLGAQAPCWFTVLVTLPWRLKDPQFRPASPHSLDGGGS